MGKASAVVNDIKPAKAIVDEMVSQAADVIRENNARLTSKSKL